MNYRRNHIDYAYTLQGWLKDINGYRVDINSTGVYDIGEDGSNTNYVNKRFGRDLFSSMIQFYQTDYSPISGNNYFNLASTNSIDLYNGNISAISVGIKDLNPLLKSYRYDKINRIKEMKSAGLNNNVWVTLTNLFGSTYSYDFNGNIESLIRYDENGNVLHNISYTYSADRNRLSSINVTGTGIGSSSYQYDALGNLIRDINENINVTWNVIGKVKSVQTPNNMLNFAYNPFGQRQIKRTASDSTYYIHDATGNVMSIYVKDYPKIIAKERPIYGSSRLGIMNKEVEFNLTGNFLSKSNSTIGIKEYELCDHLSNVSVVIFDRKECTNSVIKPIVKTYTDYYPFGYPISSRTDNVDYRYGFNGQEGDDEIYGNKLNYVFEYRMCDTRIGRFWSVDPLRFDYPWNSTYAFAENRVVNGIDLEGKEWKSQYKWSDKVTDKSHIKNLEEKGIKNAKNLTYQEVYEISISRLMKPYVLNGLQEDCANFAFYPLVDFASFYKLPIYFKSYRADTPDKYKIIDNDKMQFKTTDDLKKMLGLLYAAKDFYDEKNQFLVDVDFTKLQQGDLLLFQYRQLKGDETKRIHHVSTVVLATTNKISVVQGSGDEESTSKVAGKSYERNSDMSADLQGIANITVKGEKAKRWNFNLFDKNK